MFKIIKWIVIVVILAIVAFLLWRSNSSTVPTESQPAAVINSAVNSNLDQINRDVANIDTQLKASSDEFKNLGQTPSQVKIVTVANHISAVATLMGQVRLELESAVTNDKSLSLKTALNDLGYQVSNATSQLTVLVNNMKNIKPSNTGTYNPALRQSLTQLQVVLNYLQAARVDVGTIVMVVR